MLSVLQHPLLCSAGEGLGRNRQGISTPLVMQKTNARAGVIVNAENSPAQQQQGGTPGPPEKKQHTGAAIVGTPTNVLCLRNMVSCPICVAPCWDMRGGGGQRNEKRAGKWEGRVESGSGGRVV